MPSESGGTRGLPSMLRAFPADRGPWPPQGSRMPTRVFAGPEVDVAPGGTLRGAEARYRPMA